MSKIYDKYQTTGTIRGWYLKLNDGSVVGPVDTAALCGWAVDGRVGPGSEISKDKRDWLAASGE